MPSVSRVVHVSGPARLACKDRQLRVERDGFEPARVPLEDLGILVLDYAHTLVSEPLLAALAQHGCALVVCDEKHLPAGIYVPVAGSALHARTLRAQISATLPCTKRLWRSIVQAKIREQAGVLQEVIGHDRGLAAMSRCVKSGDPENVEGRASRVYFPALFGRGFRREAEAIGINSLLNYAYTLVRSGVARAVVGAGLHPALGIHHRNQYDTFALADDLMEPLRPLVDFHVWQMLREGVDLESGLSPPIKRRLLEVLVCEVAWEGKRFPLTAALERYAANLRSCLEGEARTLECPGR